MTRSKRTMIAAVVGVSSWMAALSAPGALGDGVGSYRITKITYVTSSSAYIDAGSEEGVEVGQLVEVIHADTVVATLKVTDVSSHRAVCLREEGSAEVAAGDPARFVPSATSPPSGQWPSKTEPAAGTARSGSGGTGIHGRFGARYLVVTDRTEGAGGFSQPALDVRLDGTRVGGSGFDLTVDARARRTYHADAATSKSEDLTSVYRLAAAWQEAGSPWRVTLGRQYSPALAAVNIFDGAQGEYLAKRWNAGLFTGTQPDAIDLGYSSEVREHGGYVGWRSAPLSQRSWSLTTGIIGSYEQSEINREFSYLQGSYRGPRLSAWLAEEVDLYRGWKQEAEGGSVSLTSTFGSLHFRAGEAWSFNAGYDNRRNVRLYRDRITPETEFDDQYRTGAWAGVTCRFAEHFRVGVDARTSAGGDAGSADGYTLSLAAEGMTRLGLGVRSRSTRYTNDRVEGWLHSLGAGISIGARWNAEVSGGVRDEADLLDPDAGSRLTWAGLDVDLLLGRSLFWSASFERSRGDEEATDQIFTSLSYRF